MRSKIVRAASQSLSVFWLALTRQLFTEEPISSFRNIARMNRKYLTAAVAGDD